MDPIRVLDVAKDHDTRITCRLASLNTTYILVSVILMFGVSWSGKQTENASTNDDTMTLFDFNDADVNAWEVVNDGVMGGRSKGNLEIQDGVLRFTGTLVTQGGGFTSVRTNRSLNLQDYDGLELRVRGGGRTFEVGVQDGVRRRGRIVSRRAPFKTQPQWTWVSVPFSSLRTTIFGQPVSAPDIDLAKVMRLSLFIVDGQDGPFRLEVDTIRAYKKSKD